MSTKVPRFEHGSRVPGWDDAVDLTKPADRPFRQQQHHKQPAHRRPVEAGALAAMPQW